MTLESLSNDGAPASPPLPYRCVESITATRRDPPGSATSYFIKTPHKEVLQFGEEEHFLWRSLDGQHSFAEIQTKFAETFGTEISREQFDEFLSELIKCEIVERLPADHGGRPDAPPPLPVGQGALGGETAAGRAAPRAARRGVDPAPVLRMLAWLGGPLRHFRWLLWPAGVAGVVAFGTQAPVFLAELLAFDPSTGIALLAAGLVVTGVVPALVQASVAAFYGLPSRRCWIALEPRLLPVRLRFDDAVYEALAAQGVNVVLAAPLLARLVLFVGGALYWHAYHETGDVAANLAIVIGQLALISLLLSSSPLVASDGRKWLMHMLAGRRPRDGDSGPQPRLAIPTVLWLTAVVAVAILYVAPLLALLPGTAGAALSVMLPVIGLPALIVAAAGSRLWVRRLTRGHGRLRLGYRAVGAAPAHAAALANGGTVVPFNRETVPAISPTYRPVSLEPSFVPVIVLALGFAVLESVAFVPYPYEAGGDFTILPYDSSQLNARVAGELTEVLVNEGDEVKPGEILGILSDWQQKYDLAVSKAQLQNAEANLQNLLDTPKPEDVELARKQYEAAMARLPYDKAQFERYAALVTNDTVSRANYDQVLSQYQQDQAAVAVARANYDQVRSGPTPAQIEAARALVRQYTATVAFNEDQLERTRIRATSSGKVVTANPQLMRGKWFAQGALVFTVEDHSVVQADVQVPETDIGNVRLGGNVRLRAWGYPETTFLGKSISIAPDAQTPQNSSTNIIRVRTEVPNPGDLLHPNMDGYAKLAGFYMPTWKAFLEMIERFFLIEVWSWIP